MRHRSESASRAAALVTINPASSIQHLTSRCRRNPRCSEVLQQRGVVRDVVPPLLYLLEERELPVDLRCRLACAVLPDEPRAEGAEPARERGRGQSGRVNPDPPPGESPPWQPARRKERTD